MVSLSTEHADCNAAFDVTVGGLMTETVAAGTLFDDWGCNQLLSLCGRSENGGWVVYEALGQRTILVNTHEGDR
jgi:hypothetical protein